MTAALVVLALACESPPPPPLASERTPGSEAPTTDVATPSGEAWTPDRLAELQPVLPSREGRVPRPIRETPELRAAMAWLAAVVDSHDADPQNPWAVAHGLLARGKDFRLRDGRPAVPAMFEGFGEVLPVRSHAFVRFSRERGAVPVEPHTALILKNLTEVGVSPSLPVTVAGQAMTVADLYRGTLATTYLDVAKNHTNFSSTDDMPWALQAIATWAPADGLSWAALDGTPTDLDDLTHFAVAVLAKETAFMAEAMAQNQGFERKGQGIFTFTCGGAHLLQGASYAVARGFGSPADAAAIRAQVPLMFYRFPRELAIIDSAMRSAPQHRLRLLVQRLKFTGHWMESMAKLSALGLYSPDEAQQDLLESAAAELLKTAHTLQEVKVDQHLTQIQAQDRQLHLDIIGDSAHALRGLNLALGRDTIPY